MNIIVKIPKPLADTARHLYLTQREILYTQEFIDDPVSDSQEIDDLFKHIAGELNQLPRDEWPWYRPAHLLETPYGVQLIYAESSRRLAMKSIDGVTPDELVELAKQIGGQKPLE